MILANQRGAERPLSFAPTKPNNVGEPEPINVGLSTLPSESHKTELELRTFLTAKNDKGL